MPIDPPAGSAASRRVRSALRSCALLADVPAEAMNVLVERSWLRELAPHDALFRTGDAVESMFVIVSGRVVARLVTERGDVLDMATAGPNELIGYLQVLDGSVRDCEAVAVHPTTVAVIPLRAATDMLSASPATLRTLAADLVRIVRLQGEAATRVFDSAPVRLARLLLDTAGDGDQADLDGPQALLAQRIGVTRQTLNQALRALAEQGLVTLAPGGRVVRLDRVRLAAFAANTHSA
jgi:CRP/FNR family transcriptional regulator, cyclic AMP receptor protein